MDREQAVRVTAYKPISSPLSRLDRFSEISFTVCASDNKILIVRIDYGLPKLLNVFHEVMVYL